MTPTEFIAILQDLGFEPYPYSGRAMYGRLCPAFNTENLVESCIRIGLAMAEVEIDHDVPSGSWDSMGMESVVYFPSMEWEDPDGEDYEEEEEEEEAPDGTDV